MTKIQVNDINPIVGPIFFGAASLDAGGKLKAAVHSITNTEVDTKLHKFE